MDDVVGLLGALCLVLATVSYSSSASVAELSSTIHQTSKSPLQVLKRDSSTTAEQDSVVKKSLHIILDDTIKGSGNAHKKSTIDKIGGFNNNNVLSANKKLHHRHKKDHGIPQAMKPLKVVETSAVIRNRLNKQPRDSPKPVKAIHVWGQTPFKTVVNNIMRMNRMKEQEDRFIVPFQENSLEGFGPVSGPEIKQPQLPFSAFSLPVKDQPMEVPQIIQINEHEGDNDNFGLPVGESADTRGILRRPPLLDNQIQRAFSLGPDQSNGQQEDFNNDIFAPYNTFERQEQVQEPLLRPMHIHHHRHHFHHHSLAKTKPKCEPSPCINDGVCTAFLNDYECTCPVGFMGKHCEDINQCLPNPCKHNGNCYPTKSGFQCTCVRGYKGENCEAINKCIPNPCKNNGVCQEPIRASQDFYCICKSGYKGRNCQEVDYCGTRDHCKNGGTCISGQSSHLCHCRVGFTGPDCGDIDVCRSSPCSNGGTCITNGAGQFKCQCPYLYHGFTCEEKSSRCSTFPCQNGGSCIELANSNFRCECPTRYSGALCQNLQNLCEQEPCKNNGKCLTTGDTFVCICEPEFSGTTCEVFLPVVCHGCHVNAKCIAGKCVCLSGFIGNGKVCEDPWRESNETHWNESVPSKCHPNPCYNGGTCKDNETGFACKCQENYVGPTCRVFVEALACKSQPCQHGGTCVDDKKARTYTCLCAKGYKGMNCEEAKACQPNPCENGATCFPEGNSYLCKCSKRFQGPRCEEDKCSLCDVHAHCEDGKCVCDKGYSGEGTKDECFKDGASNPRYCLPNPCRNGGTCEELPNGYICVCPPGITGNNCELNPVAAPPKPDPCASSPCHHGGTCFNEGNTFRCVCTDDYKGKTCQEEVLHFCHPNPCLHGGLCQDTGRGYTCKCTGAYRGQNCDVDDCDQCDLHAICIHGACRCRIGYKGDGFQCTKIKRCHHCHKYASCVANECICNPGYIGNGQVCNVEGCTGVCPSNSHCMRGVCVCGEDYYFDGKHCVAPPVTANTSPCPTGCATSCLPICPNHCCSTVIYPIAAQTAYTCPQHCSTTCAPTCPLKCCSEPYLPKLIPAAGCPAHCNANQCSSSCPSKCCTHETCPTTCHKKCESFCPIRCCSPDDIPPPIEPIAVVPLTGPEEIGHNSAPVITTCSAQCRTECPNTCSSQCCELGAPNTRRRFLPKVKPKAVFTELPKQSNEKQVPSKLQASVKSDPVDLSPDRRAKLAHTLSALLNSPLGKCPEECVSDCSYLCPAPCCNNNSKKKTIIEKNSNDKFESNRNNTLDSLDFDLQLDE